ncbi:hypothetical protein FB451DRAFT_1558722 [Mycena latifolia]|nr:hypothetical protein FB451DRAFT_1558722 [Mycena latifolia]
MKFSLAFNALIASAMTHALAINSGTDKPGIDAFPKYSPLQAPDTPATASGVQRRTRIPYEAGTRLSPQEDDVLPGITPDGADAAHAVNLGTTAADDLSEIAPVPSNE